MYANRVIENIETNRVQVLGTLPDSVRSSVGFFIGDCIMKRIPLTQGQFAIVDDEDFEWLNQWKWYASKDGRTFYAIRKQAVGERKLTVAMHRQILKAKKGQEVDHRNGDGLFNVRHNLRLCTKQNRYNRKLNTSSFSGFKGVVWNRSANKWQSQIGYNGKVFYLGIFFCLVKAAKTYDKAARKYFGEFANTNF